MASDECSLKTTAQNGERRFFIRQGSGGGAFVEVAHLENTLFLSDDGIADGWGFTGTMTGLYANHAQPDVNVSAERKARFAEFDHYTYSELD